MCKIFARNERHGVMQILFASAVDKWVFEGITAHAKGVIMMKTRIVALGAI